MQEADIARIVQEERERTSDFFEAAVKVAARVSLEIASHLIRPAVSAEKWAVIAQLVQLEPPLHRMCARSDGAVAVVRATHCFEIFKSLERAHLIIFDELTSEGEATNREWSKDEYLNAICDISVKRDKLMETYNDDDMMALQPEEAYEMIERIRCVENALAGSALIHLFVKEVDAVSDTMWIQLVNWTPRQ